MFQEPAWGTNVAMITINRCHLEGLVQNSSNSSAHGITAVLHQAIDIMIRASPTLVPKAPPVISPVNPCDLFTSGDISEIKNESSSVNWINEYIWFLGPLYFHGLTLIPLWASNFIHYKVSGGITYPFPNFNGCTVEVWEWISNYILNFNVNAVTYSCGD